jgi:4'-phosphopantetheinyl transferase
VKSYANIFLLMRKKRARRFHFEKDKQHFIIGRGLLRSIIGEYLNTIPSDILFTYNKKGKPFIAHPADAKLFFNLSHSENRIVMAFSSERELGIDIEYHKDLLDINGIAANYFSVNENKIFAGIPNHQKKEAFFNCWTRKEAFIKAVGDGLSIRLNSFDVSFEPEKPANLLRVGGNYTSMDEWQIFNCPWLKDIPQRWPSRGRIRRFSI